jgi:excisionase family DNA binding protein
MKFLIPIPEAARLLGIGVTHAWELARSGDLPTVRLGRRRLVPIGALAALAGIDVRQAVELLAGRAEISADEEAEP